MNTENTVGIILLLFGIFSLIIFTCKNWNRYREKWIFYGHRLGHPQKELQVLTVFLLISGISLIVFCNIQNNIGDNSVKQHAFSTPGILFIMIIGCSTIWSTINTINISYKINSKIGNFRSLIENITIDINSTPGMKMDKKFCTHTRIYLCSYSPALGNFSERDSYLEFKRVLVNISKLSTVKIVCSPEEKIKEIHRKYVSENEETDEQKKIDDEKMYNDDVFGSNGLIESLKASKNEFKQALNTTGGVVSDIDENWIKFSPSVTSQQFIILESYGRVIVYNWVMSVGGEISKDTRILGHRSEEPDVIEYYKIAWDEIYNS